jgi:ATP-dependent DNA helicase RecG
MQIERILRLLKEKENKNLEFKEAAVALPSNLFETICAMLNRDGGDILLGVADNGYIVGVADKAIDKMATNIVNLSNNNQKLNPPHILHPIAYKLEGKNIIHIQVPASSVVHKSANVFYDRSNDGDFKILESHRIAEMYNRKRNYYTEGIVYPMLRFTDFNKSLFPKVRNLIRSNHPNHPWLALDDKQLLQKAGLWKKDYQTGEEGYTLAAVLIFGKDEVLQQIIPHFKIDALVRIENKLRYDDREYIQTNLLDAYDKLMDFVGKHLPDKFFMEGKQRISLRTTIFREIAANIIAHREYTNALPTTFIIKKDIIETENANNAHGMGPIAIDVFTPFPKNPTIAKFFMQLGLMEELGSGVLNVNKYWTIYSGSTKPQFIEGTVFKIALPIGESFFKSNQDSNQDGNQDGNQDSNQDSNQDGNQDGNQDDVFNKIFKSTISPNTLLHSLKQLLLKRANGFTFKPQQLEKLSPHLVYKNDYWLPVLMYCNLAKSRKEILEDLGLSNQTKNYKTIILPLLEYKMIAITIKDIPTSKHQKYVITSLGKKVVQLLEMVEKSV